MEILTIILLGVGLSMDAFAASITIAVTTDGFKNKHGWISSASMGIFQGGMTLIGYFAGSLIGTYIESFDHYIAFALLLLIGGKMLIEAIVEMKRSKKEGGEEKRKPFSYKNILLLSLATSIDAMAAGISLLTLKLSIYICVLIIAVITFAICLVGVFLGRKAFGKFKDKAGIVGGIVLILIGVKILLEHLLF